MTTTPLDEAIQFVGFLIEDLETGPFSSYAIWQHEVSAANAAVAAIKNLRRAMALSREERERAEAFEVDF